MPRQREPLRARSRTGLIAAGDAGRRLAEARAGFARGAAALQVRRVVTASPVRPVRPVGPRRTCSRSTERRRDHSATGCSQSACDRGSRREAGGAATRRGDRVTEQRDQTIDLGLLDGERLRELDRVTAVAHVPAASRHSRGTTSANRCPHDRAVASSTRASCARAGRPKRVTQRSVGATWRAWHAGCLSTPFNAASETPVRAGRACSRSAERCCERRSAERCCEHRACAVRALAAAARFLDCGAATRQRRASRRAPRPGDRSRPSRR